MKGDKSGPRRGKPSSSPSLSLTFDDQPTAGPEPSGIQCYPYPPAGPPHRPRAQPATAQDHDSPKAGHPHPMCPE